MTPRGRLGFAVAVAVAILGAHGRMLRADWYVQVAAFADRSALEESSARLASAGFPVETETFTPKYGRPLTRLLVGPYASKAKAEAVSGKLAAIGWPGYLHFRRTAAAAPPPSRSPSPPKTPTPTPSLPPTAPPPPTAKPAVAAPAPPTTTATPAPAPAPAPSPVPRAAPPTAEPPAFPAEAPPGQTRTPTPEPEATPAAQEAPAAEAEAPPAEEPAKAEPAAKAAPVRLRGFFLSEGARTLEAPRHWSKWRNTLEVNLSGSLSEHVSWKLGGRAFYDAIYDLTDYYPAAVRRDQRLDAMFRETLVDLSLGDFDVRLGRQHIVWGEVVGLFFADVVSAKDLRDFLARDFDLIRIPQWAARVEWTKGDFHAEAIGIPYMTYDEIGVPGSEFYPYPLPLDPRIAVAPESKPPNTLRNAAWGGRLSYLVGGYDLSAFYYDSIDASSYAYRFVSFIEGPPPVAFEPRHTRIHQAGLTASKDLSPVVLKLEAVYTRGRFFPVDRFSEPGLAVRQSSVDAVLSADWLPGEWRMNAELFTHWFPSPDPDLTVRRAENGVTLLVARKLFDGKLEPEVLWIRSLEDQGWMLRARVSWLVVPALRVSAGADLFGGPPLGFFGRFDRSDRVGAEVRYTF